MISRLKSLPAFVFLPFFILVSFFYNWQNTPIYNPAGYDKEVFRYLGRVILEGGLPYRDGFDIKPPVVFYVSALGEACGGVWGNWLVFSLITAIATWIFFKRTFKANFLGAVFVSFSFLLLSCSSGLSEGGGLTRLISSAIVLVVLSFIEGSEFKGRGIVLGALTALVFWTQQNEVFALAPFLFYFLFTAKKPVIFLRDAVIGAVTCTAIVLLPFIIGGAVTDLWNQAFTYNFNFHIQWQKQTFSEKVKAMGDHLSEVELLKPLKYGLLGAFVATIFVKRTRMLLLVSVAAILIQFWAITLSARYFGHYFLSLLPYLCFLLYLASLETALDKNIKIAMRTAFAVLIAIMFFSRAPHVSIEVRMNEIRNRPPENAYDRSFPPVAKYLKEVYGQKGQFLIVNNAEVLGLAIDNRILAPNKWMVQDFLSHGALFNQIFGEFSQVMDGLEKYKTKYVLDYAASRPVGDPKNTKAIIEYLDEHYTTLLADKAKRWRFMQRK